MPGNAPDRRSALRHVGGVGGGVKMPTIPIFPAKHLLPLGGKQRNLCRPKEIIMNTWIKPEFEEISLAMEVTAYVNVGK